MEHDHVIHGLQRKRAEIAGRLEVAHAEIARLAVDRRKKQGKVMVWGLAEAPLLNPA